MNARRHRWPGQHAMAFFTRLDFLSAAYSVLVLFGQVPPERLCTGTLHGEEMFADCRALWTMHADAGTEAVPCRSAFSFTALALLQACATGRQKAKAARGLPRRALLLGCT